MQCISPPAPTSPVDLRGDSGELHSCSVSAPAPTNPGPQHEEYLCPRDVPREDASVSSLSPVSLSSTTHSIDYQDLYDAFGEKSQANRNKHQAAREGVDGHVRTLSQHTRDSSGVEFPPIIPHSSINDSCSNSGRSSISSFARKIVRSGPDLRLINTSKTGLTEKFGAGAARKSLEVPTSLKKWNTYEEPEEQVPSPTLPETPQSSTVEATPQLRPSSWLRSLRNHGSDTSRGNQSPYGILANASPNPSAQKLHMHSQSDTPGTARDVSNDDGDGSYAQSRRNASNKSMDSSVMDYGTRPSPLRPSRPNIPHWRSHNSSLLKRSKPGPSPRSPPPTPPEIFEDAPKKPQQESAKRAPKRSIKRWLRRGPLTPGGTHTIGKVINSPGTNAAQPFHGTMSGTTQARAPPSPCPSSRVQHHSHFDSTKTSDDPDSPGVSLPNSPTALAQALITSPPLRTDRREASSYFAGIDSLPLYGPTKNYSPDFIGTALGGISPSPSPPLPVPPRSAPIRARTPATPTLQDRDQHFQARMLSNRQATARSSTIPREFTPPGLTRVHTPPEFSTEAAARGKASSFFFSGPSPDSFGDTHPENLPQQAPQTPPRMRHSRGPDSSGLWDSDAVLMSQPSVETANSADPQGSERDWFRIRLDQIMADEPHSQPQDTSPTHADFAWDVPEHLAGSPLCPLNPKHKGGQKPICPYHGRRKTQNVQIKL